MKLRVWDKTTNIMIYPETNLHEHPDYDGGTVNISLNGEAWIEEHSQWEPAAIYENELIPMLYTGINDVHDKPIYEGDIIGINGKPWVVVKSLFEYLHENRDGVGLRELFEGVEVLGNIYENPTLILV